MKSTFLLLLSLFLITGLSAQKKVFLRVFDLSGKKIAKGFFAGTSDSSLFITKNNLVSAIPATKIGFIKTKRSGGHNIFVGAVALAIPISLLAVAGASDDPSRFFEYSVVDGLTGGFVIGAVFGGAIGALTAGFKQVKKYTINGKQENWLQQKLLIDKLPIY